MKIWANTIVCNEENFLWFAVSSVIDFIDKILIYDTGSKDKTLKIIELLIKKYGKKIDFKEVGKANRDEFTEKRQEMLDQSGCDWILVLDGDEVWWEDSIKTVVKKINQKNHADAIVVPFYNLVGDIYHYQSEDAGEYKILGKKGHLTIKAINRNIPNLHLKGKYGGEGYYDKDNKSIQNRDPKKIIFLDRPFLHMTHLKRSSKNGHNKFKYELGLTFPKNFKYPEVFYKDFPESIRSPFLKRSIFFQLVSSLKQPFLILKRSK